MRARWGHAVSGVASATAPRSVIRLAWVIMLAAGTFGLTANPLLAQSLPRVIAERFAHEETAREADWRDDGFSQHRDRPRRRAWREERADQPARRHEVAKGETLFRIAKRYGVTVEALQRANDITDPTTLGVGQSLVIPRVSSEEESDPADAARDAYEPRRRDDTREPYPPAREDRRGDQLSAPDERPERRARERRSPTREHEVAVSDLRRLAETMTEPAGARSEGARTSEIPAGYTFFAQLVGADLEVGRLLSAWLDGRRENPRVSAELDLDIIYGEGPKGDPERFLVPYIRTGHRLAGSGKRYALSKAMPPAGNIFVIQLQAAFIELHNRTVDLLIERHFADERKQYCGRDCSNAELAQALPEGKRRLLFNDARETVIHYYHRVIVEDFLPRLVGEDRTQDILTNGRDLFFPSGFRDGENIKRPFIPYEFALAASQFTASQIAPAYRMREGERARRFDPGSLAFNRSPRGRLRSADLVDWRYFVDILPSPPEGFNRARRIDLYIAAGRRSGRLAEAMLVAGQRAGLAPGQAVAKKLLPDLRKRGLLYIWEPPYEGSSASEGNWQRYVLRPDRATREILGGRQSPLWYYILQEAREMGQTTGFGPDNGAYKLSARPDEARYASARRRSDHAHRPPRSNGGHTLGPVGSTIVGEVLIGLAEHYALKTGKGLGDRPPIPASIYGERDRFTLTRVSAKGAQLGERYLLRNLLIDAGVSVALD